MKAHARAADSVPTSGCRRQMPPHFENVLSVASRERFLWSQAGGGGIFVSWESLKGPGDERRQLSLFAGHISISATQDRPHREHDFPFGKRSCSAVRAYVGPCQPLANAQRPAHLKQVFVSQVFGAVAPPIDQTRETAAAYPCHRRLPASISKECHCHGEPSVTREKHPPCPLSSRVA